MHSNVTIKNVSWPHFSWATLYISNRQVDRNVRITTWIEVGGASVKSQ